MEGKQTSLPNFKLLKPKQEPILDVEGNFITAKQKLLSDIEMKERQVDAAKFLIEAKMNLWYVNEDYGYWRFRDDSKFWHFGKRVYQKDK